MAWIIVRTQKDKKTQLFMNTYQIDKTGEWRDCDEKMNLPVNYGHMLEAQFELARQQAKDPEWNYEIREYLR